MVSSVTISCCKVCNTPDLYSYPISNLPISAQPFSTSPSTDSSFQTNLFICQHCGHMFLDIPPVDYYKNVIRSVAVSSEMTAFRRKQFGSLSSFFSKPPSEVRVLEIGAGNGQYSQIMSEFFQNCFATEPNSSAASNSDVHFIDAHPDNTNFLEIMSDYGTFDLICCFSYLEHLPNPRRTLGQISQLLTHDGLVLLEVPNCNHISKKGLLSEVIPDHLHYFSSRSLVTLASQVQLSLQSLNSIWDNYILSCILYKMEDSEIVTSRFSYSHNKLMAQINEQISLLPSMDKVAVWGAGHQSLFILASSQLAERVDFILDSSPAKQDKYIPGINKKILDPSILCTENVSLLFVICAGYNHEIVLSIKRMAFLGPIKIFLVVDNELKEESL